MEIKKNYSLLKHNTFGMDVIAERFIAYKGTNELIELLKSEDWSKEQWMHIGAGSNILFCQDFEGTILFSVISDIRVLEETDKKVIVEVGAGVSWDDFVGYTVNNGWFGCENLSAIPGQVGAAAIQNIGAYGAEAKDVISSVEVVDTKECCIKQIPAVDCGYDYRYSNFKSEWAGRYIVTHVTMELSKEPFFNLGYGDLRKRLKHKEESLTIADVRETIIAIRKEKLPDPSLFGNAGSFFQNPYIPKAYYNELLETYPDMPSYPVDDEVVKISAAWLIEGCDLKGLQMGEAQVYENHCLVIINKGGATPEDIMSLADTIYNEVANKYKIGLTEEVMYV